MHLLLVRSGVVRVTFEAGTAISAGLMTPPDFAHAIDAEGNTTMMIFIDAECEIGSHLRAALGGEPRCFDADARDELLLGLPPTPTGPELSGRRYDAGLGLSVLERRGARAPRRQDQPRQEDRATRDRLQNSDVHGALHGRVAAPK